MWGYLSFLRKYEFLMLELVVLRALRSLHSPIQQEHSILSSEEQKIQEAHLSTLGILLESKMESVFLERGSVFLLILVVQGHG
jgi:hypothetical protein